MEERNSQFIIACFGFHMLANSVIMLTGYVTSCSDVIKQRGNRRIGTGILNKSDATESKELLNMDDDDNIIQI